MPPIQLRGVTKHYGAIQALRGVDLTVQRGEVVGLLGPNGAGKTTLMKVLTGFIAPTFGSATIEGHDVVGDPVRARQSLGYLPENAPMYDELTVAEHLDFCGRVRGLGTAERHRAIDRVATACAFTDRLKQQIGTLSRGLRQRVGLGAAMLHGPPILILDEPTTGLDPNQIADIRALVREVGATRTVVLSTHVMSEVAAVCGRVVIVHQGQIVADGPTADIVANAVGVAITVGLRQEKVVVRPEVVRQALAELPGASSALVLAAAGGDIRFRITASTDLRPEVFRWATRHGYTLVELTLEQAPLEEVFRQLTGAS